MRFVTFTQVPIASLFRVELTCNVLFVVRVQMRVDSSPIGRSEPLRDP